MNYTEIAALKRRVTKLETHVATLETEVTTLKGTVKRLETLTKLIAPDDIKVSVGKSQKTTVIQKLNWNFRRGLDMQTAIKAAIDRLNARFGKEKITPEILAYVRSEAKRIYKTDDVVEPVEQTKTAGEA